MLNDPVSFLEDFRKNVKLLRDGKAKPSTRSQISRALPMVRQLMKKAGTDSMMQLFPPPAIGGQVLRISPIDTLYDAPFNMDYKIRGHVLDLLDQTIGIFQSQHQLFEERVICEEYIWMIMHPKIIDVSKRLFESNFFAESVEAALKEINVVVKELYEKKGKPEKDGADLMFSAFPRSNPILRFNNLTTKTDQDIQEGYMHLFAGAMFGIRNPKAHANEKITMEDALRKLAFASMLMYKLDDVTMY